MTIIYPSFSTAAPEQTEKARPATGDQADGPRRPLSYFGPADMAYIAHDLPIPMVRDILGNREDPDDGHKIAWEGLGITALMGTYFVFATVMLFRIASFATFFLR
ncbi:MAG TPA: hypothetical protein VH722_01665 [Alphaproteobacteria bacterium]|nr:hypothetical protein [Alphaproteobacteria bacterium]